MAKSTALDYLKEDAVQAVRTTPAPDYGRTQSGYGSKIPTRRELQIKNRWHRVYTIQYSNAGSAFVVVKGQRIYLGSFDPRYHAKQSEHVKKPRHRKWR